MIRLPAPSPLNGDALLAELQTAGLPCNDVALADSELLLGGLDESHRTAAESVVAVHTGEPTLERQERLTRRAQLEAVRAKSLAVWQGTDSFTQAEAQKILAGLVLRITR